MIAEVEVERFRCSPEADACWSRLLALYRLRRYDGDPQMQGRNWAEWEMHQPGHSDLGTEARLLFIASVGCLARLEEQGMAQQVGVALARRRLSAHGLGAVARRFRLTLCGQADDQKCTGCEEHNLLNLAKEWLAWALDDPLEDEPDLPWARYGATLTSMV